MTRDQFAAAALTGILANRFWEAGASEIVAMAYEFADGMVRQQKPEQEDIFALACIAADEWVAVSAHTTTHPRLVDALDRLEIATRPRAMRKVRP